MRIIVNNQNRISGDSKNFTVRINPSPEDMQKDYQVYIQQVIVKTSFTQEYLFLTSNNLNIVSREYSIGGSKLVCILEQQSEGFYTYSTNDTPSFKIKGLPQLLTFRITDAENRTQFPVNNKLNTYTISDYKRLDGVTLMDTTLVYNSTGAVVNTEKKELFQIVQDTQLIPDIDDFIVTVILRLEPCSCV